MCIEAQSDSHLQALTLWCHFVPTVPPTSFNIVLKDDLLDILHCSAVANMLNLINKNNAAIM